MPARPSRNRGRPAAALPYRERVGARLRTIRKAQRLTLKVLSGRSGVALSTLSKIELGQISVSYEKFAAVARALDVDIAALFDPRTDSAPATGSATAAVAALLADLDARQEGEVSLTIGQGVDMGRPSLLLTRVRKRAGVVVSAHVGGRCVPMMEGIFHLAGAE